MNKALECYNKSIEYFNKSIVHSPNSFLNWYHKGEALKALGRVNEAEAAFAESKELGYTG
jgi:tetratricopeptide (TPR) repeat protein